MYLSIGPNTVVPASSIVGIYDMDTAIASKHTRALFKAHEDAGRVIVLFDDIPKSFVHCVEGGESMLYLSQLSTATLLRRSGLEFGVQR